MLKMYSRITRFFLGVLLITAIGTTASAQCDPQFGGAGYVGTSSPGNIATSLVGENAQLRFNFGYGFQPSCNAANGNVAGSVTITMQFPAEYGPEDANVVTGTHASLYDWVWDPVTRQLKGTNNAPIPAGPPRLFTVQVKGLIATAGAGIAMTTLSWSANLTPPITNATGGLQDQASAGLNIDPTLPVTLVSFTAAKENRSVMLNWVTTAETNSDRFEIERSQEGKNWNKIGTIASHGESISRKNYSFSDTNPLHGENLYRLRMVDKDETFAYSRKVSVTLEGPGPDLSVYPNPSADMVFLHNPTGIMEVVLSDLTGRTVYKNSKNFTGSINVKNLPAGMYVISVKRENGTKDTQKIIVTK
ncbi:hypothetical protein DYBT9275_02495 [Dyadobacter sp. CECT 9275]|uniref:Secretion system C-terminal sorting domain-containing protein n=1 Tax=Dyadobacter helix TaxID=2822344 RepID=A0A916NBV9_9BACT|nr:T9SS type A sorting domain-containing protein [Dyadobacter sp. CECT 9275]CAG5000600.1 hypothetical protein DYBT9275_02495 [Dyadobacter sp. CECT 9275]